MSKEHDHGYVCKCGESFETQEELDEHIEREKFLGELNLENHDEFSKTRDPTEEEVLSVVEWYADEHNIPRESAWRNYVRPSYLVVTGEYVSAHPGYTGKLILQVGSGNMGAYEIFKETDDGDDVERVPNATEHL